MTISKLGAAAPQQISSSPSSVQGSTKLQGAAQQFQGLEQYEGAVNDLAQHLAADTSLNPGELRDQATSALSGLTGLDGGALQKLVQQTLDKVNQIHLSSGDRWLRSPTTDTFDSGGGTTMMV